MTLSGGGHPGTVHSPWTILAKIRFVLGYAWAKIAILWEVQNPRWAFFCFEWRYSLTNLINTIRPNTLPPVRFQNASVVKTTSGTFRVRENSLDGAIVSPAFERSDLNIAMEVLDQALHDKGASVGFLDIGANVGSFTVRLGKSFAHRGLRMWSIEPVPDNMQWLKENLRLNGLEQKCETMNIALSDRAGERTMIFAAEEGGNASVTEDTLLASSVRVSAFTADEVFKEWPKTMLIKIDVEGHEPAVLRGMVQRLDDPDECWLCIEDLSHRENLYAQLADLGFSFVKKVTPYNSWWKRTNARLD
jgi:FkbM family methyltransferase